MMILSHTNLTAWLDEIARNRSLIAPKEVGRGHIQYRLVSSSKEIKYDYTRPDLSAKEFLFPPTERLMRIIKRGKEVTLEDNLLEKEQVVFGLRPCDAHGMASFDALFRDKQPADRHYVRRRELTTLVGIACPQMWDNCFCASLGSGPDDPTHLDLLLTAVENGYAVQAVTGKGNALLRLANVEEKDAELPEIPLNEPVPVPPAEQWPAHFNDEYWLRLGERCLSCKLCTYVCPTCRCFDLRDEPVASGANLVIHERMRVWDACTASNYRTIAGGHNPRPNKGQRIRNRYYCKFYYFPVDFGPLGCVGCGRCADVCPVNIDIIEMLRDFKALIDAQTGEKEAA